MFKALRLSSWIPVCSCFLLRASFNNCFLTAHYVCRLDGRWLTGWWTGQWMKEEKHKLWNETDLGRVHLLVLISSECSLWAQFSCVKTNITRMLKTVLNWNRQSYHSNQQSPTEQNIQELWNNLKSAMELAGKERETGTEAAYETIMTENFPKLVLDNKAWI